MSIIVANWKANFTFLQAISFCKDNLPGFAELGQITGVELVICPSFEALYSVAQLLEGTGVQRGAQNCSMHTQGAYTGQVIAQSLVEVGCTYALIGHYESRVYLREQDAEIADKAERLWQVGIEPIICIGETKQEYELQQTLHVLDRQLEPILAKIERTSMQDHRRFCIAYEPIWAIGTGTIPDEKQLDAVFSWIGKKCSTRLPTASVRLLYGGSVTAETVHLIKTVSCIEGLLVGNASLDFKKFQKIVSSL
jgi:triosephosphate isomerase